ncbi:caspase family protein [Microcoleus sp. LAD1_D3]|uniref:caspase family protein n=1 Tax=Microcoleus sp. LAD1_D3 TaxID=2819365 RepID=UPI002FD17007
MSSSAVKNNKWALLIGINKYKYVRQLQGCMNDVELMTKILQENFGFLEAHITQLLDEQATRDNILTALQQLVERVGSDDIAVIHYSGHGSQMTDREGDKPDGMDETIVPWDSGRYPHENRDLTDDELYDWLLRLSEKTPYITLLFDSCHSGGIVRDTFGTSDRWIEPDTRPIEELPPSPVANTLLRGTQRDVGSSGWLPLSQRYVLIAGCSAEEKAYEHSITQDNSKTYHGALTYFLCQQLRQAKSGTTYRDIFERTSTSVTAKYSSQHPQMEGAGDRELFNVREIQPVRFVLLKERTGNRVTLGAGAAHGLTAGSQWAIYQSGTKQVAKETQKLGTVKITAVRAVTSDAEIVEENLTGSITAGTRAVEEAHFYGEMRLKVQIHMLTDCEANVNELLELISSSALLRPAEEGEPADARVYIIAPRTEIREGTPVPRLGAITKPTWAVVGADGQLMMPTRAVDEADAEVIIRENLEKIVRYRSALALNNPNLQSLLNGQVEFILKRQAFDGNWVEAKPEDDSGLIVFEEGDRLIFEIVNHHNEPIYVSVLDFGLTYGIIALYPVAGANQQFQPSKYVNIGARQGQQIELYLPDKFPNSESGGTETFKVFATTYPVDFSVLLQSGSRQSDTLLEQLLDMALTGNGERDARPTSLPPNEEWTTIERSFFLQRRTLHSEKLVASPKVLV